MTRRPKRMPCEETHDCPECDGQGESEPTDPEPWTCTRCKGVGVVICDDCDDEHYCDKHDDDRGREPDYWD